MGFFQLHLIYSLLLSLSLMLQSCSSGSNSAQEDILRGTIDYPFASPTEPLGRSGGDDKFIIRSNTAHAEYVIEIPGGARDYDIEIPLADLSNAGARDTLSNGSSMNGVKKPQVTDRELVAAMPKVVDPEERAMVDGAFGVGNLDGPRQSPSYTVKINKINNLFLNRKFEYALIEINNLLAFYPTSTRLYKMKGTVMMKLRNFKLAELAWSKGHDLNPNDLALKKILESLRTRMQLQRKSIGESGMNAENAEVLNDTL